MRREHLKEAVSAEEAFQGSEIEIGELLGRMKDNHVLLKGPIIFVAYVAPKYFIACDLPAERWTINT